MGLIFLTLCAVELPALLLTEEQAFSVTSTVDAFKVAFQTPRFGKSLIALKSSPTVFNWVEWSAYLNRGKRQTSHCLRNSVHIFHIDEAPLSPLCLKMQHLITM